MGKAPRENRVPIMLSAQELQQIDDWRFANRVATRSDAIRRLTQIALAFDAKADEIAAKSRANTKLILDGIEHLQRVKDSEAAPTGEELRNLFMLFLETMKGASTLGQLINVVASPAKVFRESDGLDFQKADKKRAEAEALLAYFRKSEEQ